MAAVVAMEVAVEDVTEVVEGAAMAEVEEVRE